MLRNSYRIRNNDVRMARIAVTLVVACFMAHATPSITGDSGHSEISEEIVQCEQVELQEKEESQTEEDII